MLETIAKTFGTSNLYEILGITPTDAQDEAKLRKAYLKVALKCHPDKVEKSEEAEGTVKFQIIGQIYEFLKDSDRRKNYDETGTWGENEGLDDLNVFTGPKIDEQMIQQFKQYYQGSDEERQDIKKYYAQYDGDIFKVIENVFLAEILQDEERIQGIIDQLIEANEVPVFEPKKSAKSANSYRKRKISKAQREAEEAEEALKEIRKKHNLSANSSLEQAILARNQARNAAGQDFLDQLEHKYSKKVAETKKSRSRGRKN